MHIAAVHVDLHIEMRMRCENSLGIWIANHNKTGSNQDQVSFRQSFRAFHQQCMISVSYLQCRQHYNRPFSEHTVNSIAMCI